MSNNKQQRISEEEILKLLNIYYQRAIEGIEHINVPVEQMAQEYLDRYGDAELAAKAMIKSQITKCTTSGVITGLGGVVSLPVAVPANIGCVTYVQLRMIAGLAHIAGYDIKSDEVQSLVYACLVGVAANELLKKTGVNLSGKLAGKAIASIPYSAIKRINHAVGFRFVTKYGSTGVVNLVRMVPGVGAIVNGAFDYVGTASIANRAYRWFFTGDYSISDKESIIEINDYVVV